MNVRIAELWRSQTTQLALGDPAYSCNKCQGEGRSLKHPAEWVDCGNVIRRGDLDLDALTDATRLRAEHSWDEAHKRPLDEAAMSVRYGTEPGETRESYVERAGSLMPRFYAFLKDRVWHEPGRLGWFGQVRTECELKADARGEEYTGRCLHRDEATGGKIVGWTGPKDSNKQWAQLFFRRFVQELPSDTTLVVVDYHV